MASERRERSRRAGSRGSGPGGGGRDRRATDGRARAARDSGGQPGDSRDADDRDRERERGGGRLAGDADPEAVARQICLRLLTAAPRTQAQLAAALRRRGVPDQAAANVLERFAEVKLIDDELFARAWVESRHHGRGLAGRALGAELRQRGVGSGDIEAALSQLDPDQELATARELVERRLAGTAGMPVPARMRRLTGVLARKGYPPGLAYRVVREALEQEGADGRAAALELANLAEPADDEVPAETWDV
jgi:regulatory protein